MNKPLAFIALIFLTIGVGLGVIALATNHWSENEESWSMGLFQTCRKDCCTNNLDISVDHREIFKKNKWYLASVGCQCGAVLLGFIAIVLGFSALCAKNPIIDRVGSICATLSFAGFLCAIVLWKFKYVDENEDMKDCSEGYSYWLAVGAAAVSGITIILKISITVALCFDKLAYAADA